jgi:hypothetical protein
MILGKKVIDKFTKEAPLRTSGGVFVAKNFVCVINNDIVGEA